MSPGNNIEKKTIASPKIVSKFSPINSIVHRQGLTVNTGAMGVLKKYGAKNPGDESEQISAFDQNGKEEDKTNAIPIANFKSNKLSHIDKKHRAEEFEKMMESGEPGSPKLFDAIRLPNTATS